MSGTVLDTSVLISAGDVAFPEHSAVSVVTLGELRAGIDLARTEGERRARTARLAGVRELFTPLPIDEDVALTYGEILAVARRAGRTTKATDLLIIATAIASARGLFTLDQAQRALAELAGARVVG